VPFVRDRYLGYRQALEEAGIPEDPCRVLLEPSMHPSFEDPLQDPTNLAKDYLATNRDAIDGVVCAGDFLAHGCLLAALELGIKVPKQLKIVGIDDFRSIPNSDKLTTYHIPYEEMGEQAFHTLEAQLIGGPALVGEQQLRGTLIVRESA
jgi:DNA-binding LacI/PurR family transcriptional regulator